MDKAGEKDKRIILIVSGICGCLLLCGICVLAILGALSSYATRKTQETAQIAVVKSSMGNISNALIYYYENNGEYPDELDELVEEEYIISVTIDGEEPEYNSDGDSYELSIELPDGEIYTVNSNN